MPTAVTHTHVSQKAHLNSRPALSVVIVSLNTREVLRRCLTTLDAETRGLTFEVIVVDNASRDGSPEMVKREFPAVRLICAGGNLGFAAANNLAFRVTQGDYIVLLNSDAFLRPGALRKAIEHMDNEPQTGLGGARLTGEDGSWQPSARQFPCLFNDFLSLSGISQRFRQSRLWGRADRTWADPLEDAHTDWVPGAFSIIRGDLLEQMGGFDESFFLYYEEVDLCRRIKAAGYAIRYWPDVEVVHLGGESSKSMSNAVRSTSGAQLTLWRLRSAFLYYRKHHKGGAWRVMALEYAWHFLRQARNRISGEPARQHKAGESGTILALIRQAWRETRGGAWSPPKPW